MSEDRKPQYTVTFRTGRRKTLKFEVFRKSQWTGKKLDEYHYRVRVNGVWYGGTHSAMLFLGGDDTRMLLNNKIAEKM